MAVSELANTYGVLDEWPIRMNIPIYHFNQIEAPDAPFTEPGMNVYVQPERESIAEGIKAAIALMLNPEHLEFYHRPVYLYETLPLYYEVDYVAAKTRFKYVDAIGKRGLTPLQPNAAVSFNGNTATITFALASAVSADEIQVFFRVADGAPVAADERWQINQLTVSLSGLNVTITGHKALFANPALWRSPYQSPNYNQSAKNVGKSANPSDFITQVDVYRVYPDKTGAVTLLRDRRFAGGGSDADTYETAVGKALIEEDGRFGILRITDENGGSVDPTQHEAVKVYYRAGYPLDSVTGQPDRALLTALIRLGNCRQPVLPTTFDDPRLTIFQNDTAVDTVDGKPIREATPLGIRRGEVEAWDIFQTYKLRRSSIAVV